MSRRKYFIAIDTETCGDLEAPFVYDAGIKVYDFSFSSYEEHSFVVYDTYVGMKDLMQTAYYANKLPQYEIDLRNGKRKMVRFFTLRRLVWNLMKKYNTKIVVAYNTKFDRNALNNTLRVLTNGERKYFFPYGTEFLDVWTMACSTVCQTRGFRKAAYDNEWYSPKGNVRTSAEVVYAYVAKHPDFIECHTALEDVNIEVEIMRYCWRKAKKEDRGIIANPWRRPQPFWYYTEARKDGRI